MHGNISSDFNTTMAASLTFEAILKEVQTSNLNFRIEMSPFSAVINLKKSFITNKFGVPILSPPSHAVINQALKSENLTHTQQIVKLEKTIDNLRSEYESVALELKDSHESMANLNINDRDALQEEFKHSEKIQKLEESKSTQESHLKLAIDDLKEAKEKIIDLEEELASSRIENDQMKEDLERNTRNHLEVTKKFAVLNQEYQCKIVELKSYRDVQILEERKEKKEKKKERKQTKKVKDQQASKKVKEQQAKKDKDPEIEIKDDVKFVCTICAQTCSKSELSTKSEPEERDTCRGCNIEEDLVKVNEPDSNQNSETETVAIEDPLIETIAEEFGEFLENFADDDGSNKYEARVKMLVNLSEHILDVSCSDIRAHNISLRKSLEIVGLYCKAFPHLCRTVKAFVETKVGHEAANKYYLLRLVK